MFEESLLKQTYGKALSEADHPLTSPPPRPPQPENAIKVKPFSLEDGSDPTADTVLYELAPFLRALATQVTLLFWHARFVCSGTCLALVG